MSGVSACEVRVVTSAVATPQTGDHRAERAVGVGCKADSDRARMRDGVWNPGAGRNGPCAQTYRNDVAPPRPWLRARPGLVPSSVLVDRNCRNLMKAHLATTWRTCVLQFLRSALKHDTGSLRE
eukprot:5909279-Prymnesium_polylepis.1